MYYMEYFREILATPYTYVVVNVLLALVIAPLLDGIERKVKARIQNRRGPPILQTIYDLSKLYSKGSMRLRAPSTIYTLAPYLTFSSMVLCLVLLPTFTEYSLSFYGDLIVLLYLITSASIYMALGGLASGNPLASIGSAREIMISMASKLALALALIAIAVSKGSFMLTKIFPVVDKPTPSIILSIAILLIIAYVEGLRLPFDIPEAEPEIAGGVLIEYGCMELGLMLHSIILKRFILASIIINLVLPKISPLYIYGIDLVRLVLFTLLVTIISIIYSMIEALSGRYRIDMALSLVKKVTIISLVAAVVAVAGY